MKLHDAVLWWPTFWMQLIRDVLIPRKLSRTNAELRSSAAAQAYVDDAFAHSLAFLAGIESAKLAAAEMSAVDLSAPDDEAPQ